MLDIALGKKQFSADALTSFIAQCTTDLHIDIPSLLDMPDGTDVQYLIATHQFTNEQLHTLAGLFYELAIKTTESPLKVTLLQKARNIYQHIQANGNGTLYLDVAYRLKELTK